MIPSRNYKLKEDASVLKLSKWINQAIKENTMSEAIKIISQAQTKAPSEEPAIGALTESGESAEPVVSADPIKEAVDQEKAKQETKTGEDLFSSKFAALSRREKELKRKEAELDEKLTEFQTADTLQTRMKERPLKVLEELGISYDDLTQMALNEGSPTNEMLIERMQEKSNAQIEELRNEYISDKEAASKLVRSRAILISF